MRAENVRTEPNATARMRKSAFRRDSLMPAIVPGVLGYCNCSRARLRKVVSVAGPVELGRPHAYPVLLQSQLFHHERKAGDGGG